MTTLKPTTHRLLSVNPFPAVCDACGRECPERHLVIVEQATGKTMKVGIACAWNFAAVKPTDRIAPVEIEDTEQDRAESAAFAMSWMNGVE